MYYKTVIITFLLSLLLKNSGKLFTNSWSTHTQSNHNVSSVIISHKLYTLRYRRYNSYWFTIQLVTLILVLSGIKMQTLLVLKTQHNKNKHSSVNKMHYNTKISRKSTVSSIAFYNHWQVNRVGLFLQPWSPYVAAQLLQVGRRHETEELYATSQWSSGNMPNCSARGPRLKFHCKWLCSSWQLLQHANPILPSVGQEMSTDRSVVMLWRWEAEAGWFIPHLDKHDKGR